MADLGMSQPLQDAAELVRFLEWAMGAKPNETVLEAARRTERNGSPHASRRLEAAYLLGEGTSRERIDLAIDALRPRLVRTG